MEEQYEQTLNFQEKCVKKFSKALLEENVYNDNDTNSPTFHFVLWTRSGDFGDWILSSPRKGLPAYKITH